jgi:hypothetical protein
MQVTHLGLAKTGRYGLGNQLFQVAATIGIATENNLQYGFPEWHNNNLFRKKLPGVGIGQGVIVKEKSFEYNPVEVPNNCFTFLEGYFQSWKYFQNSEALIKETFEFNGHLFPVVQNVYEGAKLGTTCSISVRRGDYVRLQDIHPLQPDEYWVNAQQLVESKDKIDTYLVFSDDITWCRENKQLFTSTGKKVIFVEGRSQADDFMMITLCNHNIITNSTFSWWGAYLNKNADKTVIMPKLWFGPTGPWSGPSNAEDLHYPDWYRI